LKQMWYSVQRNGPVFALHFCHQQMTCPAFAITPFSVEGQSQLCSKHNTYLCHAASSFVFLERK
jgi:hypothetical protein